MKRHIRAVNVAGGVLLILIGVLMVPGLWRGIISAFGAVIVSGFQNPLEPACRSSGDGTPTPGYDTVGLSTIPVEND